MKPLPLVAILTTVAFQSHWLDDLGTGDPDVAGRVVSAVGTLFLLGGVLLLPRRAGRLALALGFLFTAMVSIADLSGLGVGGAFAPDVVEHWRSGLGWGFTALVAATLLLSVAGTAILARVPQAKGQ
ncbi:MAG TPA: hypothetical protein VNZ52_00450 [Candidatus Thermoplasmatota archaeon]|nr:hypothetical protein [Candidatus Thermoplasmatota archaeon]